MLIHKDLSATVRKRYKSSHWRNSVKTGVLKSFKNSQENICVGVSVNKVTCIQAYNFIKKRLQHRCFPVNTTKFLRTPTVSNRDA